MRYIHSLIKKGNIAFSAKNYHKSLEYYSLGLNLLQSKKDSRDFQKNMQDLQILAMLSDMAFEFENEAMILFEFYQIVRIDKKNKFSKQDVLEHIKHIDFDFSNFNTIVANMHTLETQSNQGILYKDFKEISTQQGFKKTYDKLLYKDRILFDEGEDLILFLYDLLNNDCKEELIDFLEIMPSMLYFNPKIMEICEKLKKGKS